MPLLLALLLTAAQPVPRTDWMSPSAYHLTIGMKRAAAVEALHAWTPKPGSSGDEVVVDFSGERALTLRFRKDRLISARFELFAMLPDARRAFDELRARLLADRGKPRRSTKSVLVYDNALPNLLVAIADDPKSEQGRRGLGVVAVRYFDPR